MFTCDRLSEGKKKWHFVTNSRERAAFLGKKRVYLPPYLLSLKHDGKIICDVAKGQIFGDF